MNNTTAPETSTTPTTETKLTSSIVKTIARKSFCTLGSTSTSGYAHNAGVIYEMVDGTLWIHASINSRKARNISANPQVGVCIPFRRMPFGPPYTIHFQAHADVVPMDSPVVTRLLERGKLKKISGHGALDMADGCFLAIRPNGRAHSFGPGARIIDLIRDPLNSGARSVDLPASS